MDNYYERESSSVLGRRFAIKKKRKRMNFDVLKGFFQRLKSRGQEKRRGEMIAIKVKKLETSKLVWVNGGGMVVV